MAESNRRNILQGAVATGLAFGAGATAHAADPSGKVTYWHHFRSQEEFKGLQRVMELFKRLYPKVDLVQEDIPPPAYMTKFTAAVLAKSPPDATMIAAERVDDMLAMNGLVDLTGRVNGWASKANYPESGWQGCTRNGKIYGVPAFTYVDWAYWRRDWFEQAGIDGAPDTLDDFLAAAKKLTDPSKNRYGFGMRGGLGGYVSILDLIESFGSPIVIDGRNAMDRPKAVAAVKWYSDLATVHKVVPPSAANDGFLQIIEGFKTGQTAMTWHQTGSLVEIMRYMKPGTYATAIKPKGPATRFVRLSYSFNGLMKTDNAEAAWDWCGFRRKAAGDSDPFRPLIPTQAGHRFR